MANISWTTYRCPQCKRVLDKHLGTAVGMRLGPELITCPCGKIVSSGTREWSSLSEHEKRDYLLLMFDVVLVCVGIAFVLYASHFAVVGLLISIGIAAIYALVPLSKLKAVRDSKKRTKLPQ